MIPSKRFGDIRVVSTGSDYITCDLYSLYEHEIVNVAGNKEFCLFIMAELYSKIALHDRAVMAWDGEVQREEAAALYHKLDKTSHLFYKECLVLLKGSNNPEEALKLPDEDKFRAISTKTIKDFVITGVSPLDDTFKEYGVLDIFVSNTKLIYHVTEGLLLEC